MESIMNTLASGLSSMPAATNLGGSTFAVLPEKIGLCDPETKHFSGVTIDLPSETTAASLSEAVRIGRGPLLATLQFVKAMAEAGPGPNRRQLMDRALDKLADFGTVLLGCLANSKDNLLSPLQGEVHGVISHIDQQNPDLLPVPLAHYGLELWAERGAIYLIDDQNKRREEYVIPLIAGTALIDIAASLKTTPLALALLALLEIEKHSKWSQDLHELIREVGGRMAADMAHRALTRLSPEAPVD